MINILRNKVFIRVFILFVSILSFSYWFAYMNLAKKSIPIDKYSQSYMEGVKLSKYHDLRGIVGSLNQMHQYSDYLSEASYYISKTTNKRFLPENIIYPNWLRYVNNDKPVLSSASILPVWSDDFILGFYNKTTFKISENNIQLETGALPKNVIVGKTAILRNDDANFYVTITDIGDSGSITVQGYIPYDFFPKSILIPSGVKKNKKMMFETDSMGWVRGGRFSLDPTGHTNVIRHLPSLGLSKTVLETGDSLSWEGMNGVNTAKIVSVNNFNGTFIVKLDKKFPPYFDFRKTIINVTRKKNNDEKQEMVFNVDTDLINDEFFLGKKRKTSFVVYSSNDITPGSIVVAEGTNSPLFVSNVSKNDNIVTIDLFNSAIVKKCLRIVSKENYNNCMQKLESSKLESGDLKWAMHNLMKSEKRDVFGPLELWNRGGDLKLQFVSDKNKEITKPALVTSTKNNDTSNPGVASNGLIWEIYPGSLLNIFYSSYNPAPTEMLIHVLGREARDQYYSSFVRIKPEYISFAKPERFTPWILNWHWPFFRNMINNYDLAVNKSEFSLWHINNNNNWDTFGPVHLKLQGDFPINKSIQLYISNNQSSSCDIKLMTAVVKYEIKNPMSSIPLMGKLPRHLLEIENTGLPSNLPVSLPWSENTFSFPIFYRDGFKPVITPRILANFLNLTSMNIKEITLYEENVDNHNIYNLYYDYPAVGDAAKYNCKETVH
ncbi:hypothetical protein CKY10_14200 [Photorhabdus sp. HUG-39]|uniref:Uncharacterized protein n=1 Tax=Photorhabdus kayaii TaxID=230088 RepID=A0ABX0B1R5_9GAMM|nr:MULTISPECIES: hypothetical protein [Photorhabdus]MCC8375628.1 hypothetical protein [Photorhabdus bodei]NDL12827.1 hypothetical protein [Photorhabdus kayaii]NDL26589.1 hypothetical protein [Photorhabdus kayaii]RAX08803.1 hypothetical protein CKY10_14200 [Photorhabdus sp. HUG-39]